MTTSKNVSKMATLTRGAICGLSVDLLLRSIVGGSSGGKGRNNV